MPKPRIQRCFLTWLEEARPRLAVQPRLIRRTRRSIELRFEGITAAISANLNNYEVNVWVERRGTFWDIIFNPWVEVRGRRGGYFCGACPANGRASYATREALWQAHLFEEFEQWVNDDLARATHLLLYDWDRMGQHLDLDCDPDKERVSASSARLWRDGDDQRHFDGATFVLPVRVI